MKVQFKNEEESHVGVYLMKDWRCIVLFPASSSKRTGIIIGHLEKWADGKLLNETLPVGQIRKDWFPCDDKNIWVKLAASEVTFTW